MAKGQSDKLRACENIVKLTGVLTEIEVKQDKTKTDKIPYVSIKGSIQFGDNKAASKEFKTFAQAYRIDKETKEEKENKLYQSILDFAENAKSVVKVGEENATKVTVSGSFADNVYVNSAGELKEGLNIEAKFFNDIGTDEKNQGVALIEGYLKSIVEEVKGEDKEPTGRLRITILTTDFFGNIIPIKNIIVPSELAEVFQDNFEVGQTFKAHIDFVPTKTAKAKPAGGGIGVQRNITEGKTYCEMVLVGTEGAAYDEDSELAITAEAIKIGLSERKNKLEEIKNKAESAPTTNKASKGKKVKSEELPF